MVGSNPSVGLPPPWAESTPGRGASTGGGRTHRGTHDSPHSVRVLMAARHRRWCPYSAYSPTRTRRAGRPWSEGDADVVDVGEPSALSLSPRKFCPPIGGKVILPGHSPRSSRFSSRCRIQRVQVPGSGPIPAAYVTATATTGLIATAIQHRRREVGDTSEPRVAGLIPVPPIPPHPHWYADESRRTRGERLAGRARPAGRRMRPARGHRRPLTAETPTLHGRRRRPTPSPPPAPPGTRTAVTLDPMRF